MTEKHWYVRVRGRVIGPFDLLQLRSLRDRGQFRRVHEIPEDRQAGRPASSMAELFSEARESLLTTEASSDSDNLIPTPLLAVWYYLGDHEKPEGPVSQDRLQSLLREGIIGASTPI